MTGPTITIDERYAWVLLRDAAAARVTRPAHRAETPAIEIDADGRWHSDSPATPEASALLDALVPVAFGGASFVIAQIGQSLDGRIATDSGHSHYVTGTASRIHLHRLRALVDAVIVGPNTVITDDPQLTVRHVDGENPVRVVLDPADRVPTAHRVFTDGAAPTLHLVASDDVAGTADERVRLVAGADGVEPRSVLAALAARGLRRVLVEGGGRTISRFLAAGCLDRLHTVVAPLIIGSGRPALSLAPIERLDQARRPPTRSQAIGEDWLFDLDLVTATG